MVGVAPSEIGCSVGGDAGKMRIEAGALKWAYLQAARAVGTGSSAYKPDTCQSANTCWKIPLHGNWRILIITSNLCNRNIGEEFFLAKKLRCN